MKPTLSICVPSYNRLTLLKRLSKQLLLLKSEKIEFVFIDDNSTEKGVVDYLEEIKGKDNRVSLYLNKHNLGITKNYYAILNKAKGKYVMLLSNEDQIKNKFEEIVLNLLESDNYNAIYGYLEHPNKQDYYYDEYPKETTSDFEFIKKNYAQIVFKGHLSGHIYKKSIINFELLEKFSNIEDNYWPIAPITLMAMKTRNVLFIKESFVLIGSDCVPETENILKISKKKKEIKQLFSLSKRADLYSFYIENIINNNCQVEFKEILARYFLFFLFKKKRNGISKLRQIKLLRHHEKIGFYFNNELNTNYFKNYLYFFKSCLTKYISL